MKSKYIYPLLSLLLIVFAVSCSSDDPILSTEAPTGKTHSVKFVIKGIEVESSEIKTRSDNNTLSIKYLEYWVYKADEIPSVIPPQSSILHNYIKGESIKNDVLIELPEGDYKIIFYASDKEDITPSENPFTLFALGYQYQMFSKTVSFNISQDKLAPIQEVVLEREVGQLQFVIEDLESLPANVKSIRFFLMGIYWGSGRPAVAEPYYLNLGYNSSVEHAGSKESTFPILKRGDFASISSQNPLSFYSIPSSPMNYPSTGHIIPRSLYIVGCTDDKYHAYDSNSITQGQNDKIVFIRRVGQYTVVKNQITRYTGKIGPVNVGGGNVIIDGSWNETIINVE